MFSQAYTHAYVCMYTNMCACMHACMHTHACKHKRQRGVCVCAFSVFQLYMIQNSLIQGWTMVVKRIMSFSGRMLKQATPHHSAQHNITKWYLIRSSTFPVTQTMPVLQDGCKTETSIRTGYMIQKCFLVIVTLTESVFPEPVWAIPTMSWPLMAIGQPWHWIAVGASNPDFLQKCKDMHSHWCGMPDNTWP